MAFQAIAVAQTIGLAEPVLHVKALHVGCPSLMDPHVRAIGRCDRISKPLMPALMNDDEIEFWTDTHTGPITA